jgi:hypothetical protein
VHQKHLLNLKILKILNNYINNNKFTKIFSNNNKFKAIEQELTVLKNQMNMHN